MLVNIILLLIGIVIGFYGIKTRTKLFVIVGGALVCFSLISAGIDYKMGMSSFDNHRLPFVIDGMMK